MDAAHGLLDDNGQATQQARGGAGRARRAGQGGRGVHALERERQRPGIDNLLRGMKGADGRQARRRFLPEDKRASRRVRDARAARGQDSCPWPAPRSEVPQNRKVPSSWGVNEAQFGAAIRRESARRFPLSGGFRRATPAVAERARSRHQAPQDDQAVQRRPVARREGHRWLPQRREPGSRAGDRERAAASDRRCRGRNLDDDPGQRRRARRSRPARRSSRWATTAATTRRR